MRNWFLMTVLATGCGAVDDDGDGAPADVDCDDTNPDRSPAAAESCNSIDDDCDGDVDEGTLVTTFPDADRDGYGDGAMPSEACTIVDGQVEQAGDCDDDAVKVHPGTRETCNSVDDDCDGETDEDLLSTWYTDADQDGVGGPAIQACSAPSGAVELGGDCDDASAAVSPLVSETCDGLDQDCDGLVDEGVGLQLWPDDDSDGYGDANDPATTGCTWTDGYATNSADCDDLRADVYPGAAEICDAADQNCNAAIDEGTTVSQWADGDGDGYGDPALRSETCAGLPGLADNALDCDDTESLAHHGAAELCDEVDNDCDGAVDEGMTLTWFRDDDGDGAGPDSSATTSCAPPADAVYVGGDCDDGDGSVYPRAIEVCDTVDQDCDGRIDEGLTTVWWPDADLDTYGDDARRQDTCVPAADAVYRGGDCLDDDPTAHPLASEVCDEVDDDCDGVVDEGVSELFWVDDDGDGSGSSDFPFVRGCDLPNGYALAAGDCDDGDSEVGGTSCVTSLPGAWTTLGGDDGRTGHVAGLVGGGTLVQVWSATEGDLVRGPVITNGQVYLVSDSYYTDDKLVALDAIDGALAWGASIGLGNGASTPTVADGVVFVEQTYYGTSLLAAVDEVTGGIVWQTGFSGPYYYGGDAPAVLGSSVFLGAATYDYGLAGHDAATGMRQWATVGGYYERWAPVVYDGLVYGFYGVTFAAHDPSTGAVVSSVELDEYPVYYSQMNTAPAIADGTALLIAGDDLVAVDLDTFEVRWSIEDGFMFSPSLGGGLGYAVRNGAVVQVELASGLVIRTFTGDGTLGTKPVVTDDVVIVTSTERTWVYQLWDGVELDQLPVGGTAAVGEGMLTVTSGNTVRAYTWQ